MNMKLKHSIIPFILFGTIFNNSFAQISRNQLSGQDLSNRNNAITTAVPFLLIAPDSRSGSMGDAGVASKPDVNSIHWNPAKLAFAENKYGAGISYTPWLQNLVPDINLGYLSGYYKLDDRQTVAASLLYFSLGEILFTDPAGNPNGSQIPNEFAIDGAYSGKLSENFSLGLAARFIRSALAIGQVVSGQEIKPGTSAAVDISSYYQREVSINQYKTLMAWGINISNIGTKMNYTTTTDREFIPINLRIGGSAKIELDDYNELTFLLDLNKLLVPTPPIYSDTGRTRIIKGEDPNRSVPAGMFYSFTDAPGGFKEELHEITYSTGFEYWYDKQFSLRGGYFYEHPTKGNRQFFTAGVGLKYNLFGLDFSYLVPAEGQRNPLANTLRFSLRFDFDQKKDKTN